MTRLDTYSGALPGRFQYEGNVGNSPARLLRDEARDPRWNQGAVEVTRYAMERMTQAELEELRAAASELNVHLNEIGTPGGGLIAAVVAAELAKAGDIGLSVQDREYYKAALDNLAKARMLLQGAKACLAKVHYLYGTTSIECMLTHEHCVSEHVKGIMAANAGGAQ